jgi:hypothetical protein
MGDAHMIADYAKHLGVTRFKRRACVAKYVLAALAASVAMSGYSPASAKWRWPYPTWPVDIHSDPAFANYKTLVVSYLRQHSRHHRTHACVIGLRSSYGTTAWVIWRGGGKLILYPEGETDLNLSNRQLSLSKDVVATDEQVGTSTYLVSRPWVNWLERQCSVHGRRVTVN